MGLKCVCSTCSPSSIQFDEANGKLGLARVCKSCVQEMVDGVPKGDSALPPLMLQEMGDRLCQLTKSSVRMPGRSNLEGVEEACRALLEDKDGAYAAALSASCHEGTTSDQPPFFAVAPSTTCHGGTTSDQPPLFTVAPPTRA